MRTQVCIIGGGPSGLLLSQLLHLQGIDTVLLERSTRAHVMGRIRAGVLEFGMVELLRRAGVGARMEREGLVHDGIRISTQKRDYAVDFAGLTGKRVMIWGQTEITADLYTARDGWDAPTMFEVSGVTPQGLDTDAPFVTYRQGGTEHRIDCDFIAGCDGFHGVSRKAIPAAVRREHERVYPFGWLGVLSQTPPVSPQVAYANHPRGFALCSMRNGNLSRYYIQVPVDDPPEAWSDAAFWDELKRRLPERLADTLITGPSIEKSVAPLRSFVSEPMRWGRLMLVGDAAHIVPPTGAKGLNLAASDVYYLSGALTRHYKDHDTQGIEDYSQLALARVWQAMRFSWWFTNVLHRFPAQSEFDQRMQETELDYLAGSQAAQTVLAENYVGLPY